VNFVLGLYSVVGDFVAFCKVLLLRRRTSIFIIDEDKFSAVDHEIRGLLLLHNFMQLADFFLQHLIKFDKQPFPFSLIKFLQELLVDAGLVFAFRLFGSVVVRDDGEVLGIAVDEGLEEEVLAHVEFVDVGEVGEEEIGLDFGLDEGIDDDVDVGSEIVGDGAVAFPVLDFIELGLESADVVLQRPFAVLVEEVEIVALPEHFVEFDEVVIVYVAVDLVLLPVDRDFFLALILLQNFHVGVLRLFLQSERVVPVETVDDFDHATAFSQIN
jgi:hypothetical protein